MKNCVLASYIGSRHLAVQKGLDYRRYETELESAKNNAELQAKWTGRPLKRLSEVYQGLTGDG